MAVTQVIFTFASQKQNFENNYNLLESGTKNNGFNLKKLRCTTHVQIKTINKLSTKTHLLIDLSLLMS